MVFFWPLTAQTVLFIQYIVTSVLLVDEIVN